MKHYLSYSKIRGVQGLFSSLNNDQLSVLDGAFDELSRLGQIKKLEKMILAGQDKDEKLIPLIQALKKCFLHDGEVPFQYDKAEYRLKLISIFDKMETSREVASKKDHPDYETVAPHAKWFMIGEIIEGWHWFDIEGESHAVGDYYDAVKLRQSPPAKRVLSLDAEECFVFLDNAYSSHYENKFRKKIIGFLENELNNWHPAKITEWTIKSHGWRIHPDLIDRLIKARTRMMDQKDVLDEIIYVDKFKPGHRTPDIAAYQYRQSELLVEIDELIYSLVEDIDECKWFDHPETVVITVDYELPDEIEVMITVDLYPVSEEQELKLKQVVEKHEKSIKRRLKLVNRDLDLLVQLKNLKKTLNLA